jgi:molybdate transport system substrate-binding protein
MPSLRASRRRSLTAPAALTAIVTALTVACGEGAGVGGDEERELTVLAAASLTEPLTELAERFEEDRPGVRVVTTFESSATVAARVIVGVPTDVVATADVVPMQVLEDDGLLSGPPVPFARNEIVLVVPRGNPGRIGEVTDLQRADYVMCASAAPCGRLAATLLNEADVTNPAGSLEEDVKAVLAKVVAGEAEAGLVYASDVVAAGDDVAEVPLPESLTVTALGEVAVLAASREPDLAAAFVDLLLSPAGQQALVRAGFDTVVEDAGSPSPP